MPGEKHGRPIVHWLTESAESIILWPVLADERDISAWRRERIKPIMVPGLFGNLCISTPAIRDRV
jgi:hypothetical protein